MEALIKPYFAIEDFNDPRASHIENGLYLGDEEAAKDLLLLEKLKIKRIVTVGKELEIFYPDNFDYMKIDIYDHQDEDIYQYFEPTFKFIDESLSKNENVLVHCKYGISRSATIVCSYLIQKHKYVSFEVVQWVYYLRDKTNPNIGFKQQLGQLCLRYNTDIFRPKKFKKKHYSHLPIETPYAKHEGPTCRIKLRESSIEKGVELKKTKGRKEDMIRDKNILKFCNILSLKREDLMFDKIEDQKKKLMELISDKNLLVQICFPSKSKRSVSENNKRIFNLKRRLERNTDKIIKYLFGSKFMEEVIPEIEKNQKQK
jgi:protein-tyrosine phosphatase